MFSLFINGMLKERLRKLMKISTYRRKNLNSDLKNKNANFLTYSKARMMIYYLINNDLKNGCSRRQILC